MDALSKLADWYITNVRLTCFADLTDSDLLVKILSEAFGSGVKKETKHPPLNRIDYEFVKDERLYEVETESHRFNIFCRAHAEREALPTSFPNIGTFAEVENWFLDVSSSILASSELPSVKRVAIGLMVQQEADSREDAYNQLSKFLPFDLDARISSDFLYRLNRPKEEKYRGDILKINRVAAWSCPFYRVQRFSNNPGQSEIREFYSIGIDMDINTDSAVDGDFDKSILGILTSQAHAICLHGDE